jgi:polygalacturonase
MGNIIVREGDVQGAIDDCAAGGGGAVVLPAGRWESGPLELRSGVELRLEAGSVLAFTDDFSAYRPVWTRWEGVRCHALHPLLWAYGCRNVSVTGSGILDGRGAAWWAAVREARRLGRERPLTELELELAELNRGTQFLRPPLPQFMECEGVRLEGISLVDSPFWTVHPLFCKDVRIRGITVVNPPEAPNTDGLDIDSCEDVQVEDCRFDVGDDCLCLKSGSGPDGREVGLPTRGVSVSGCLMRSGHGGVVIGSETAGGVRGATFRDCVFDETDRGIRVKSRRGRGGRIEDLEFRGIEMRGVLCPLVVNMYYRCGSEAEPDFLFSLGARPRDEGTPALSGLRVADCRATGIRAAAALVAGLAESPIEGLHVSDCDFSLAQAAHVPADQAAMSRGLPPATGRGMRFFHVKGGKLRGVRVLDGSGSPLPPEIGPGADLSFSD